VDLLERRARKQKNDLANYLSVQRQRESLWGSLSVSGSSVAESSSSAAAGGGRRGSSGPFRSKAMQQRQLEPGKWKQQPSSPNSIDRSPKGSRHEASRSLPGEEPDLYELIEEESVYADPQSPLPPPQPPPANTSPLKKQWLRRSLNQKDRMKFASNSSGSFDDPGAHHFQPDETLQIGSGPPRALLHQGSGSAGVRPESSLRSTSRQSRQQTPSQQDIAEILHTEGFELRHSNRSFHGKGSKSRTPALDGFRGQTSRMDSIESNLSAGIGATEEEREGSEDFRTISKDDASFSDDRGDRNARQVASGSLSFEDSREEDLVAPGRDFADFARSARAARGGGAAREEDPNGSFPDEGGYADESFQDEGDGS